MLCDSVDFSMPGFPVLYYLPEFAQKLFTKLLIFSRFYQFFHQHSFPFYDKSHHVIFIHHVSLVSSDLFFMVWILWRPLVPYSIVQFSSVAQSCPTLCNPMNRSTPGLPVHHQLPESTQTHVHRVGDAIQSSHPLSSPSPTFNLSQHQGLFKWVSSY